MGAIDDLPEIFRIVFVMRDIEELRAAETAGFSTCLRRRGRPDCSGLAACYTKP
jgi:DNA-directed RNA polymerase specialized sigma24 family protein